MDTLSARFDALSQTMQETLNSQKQTMQNSLKDIQDSNEKKLEQMRLTVDEKVHSTLEKRLNSSFQIRQTVSDQVILSYSHYLFLIRIDNLEERKFYEIESSQNNWSLREAKRQFDSALFERLSLSKDKIISGSRPDY